MQAATRYSARPSNDLAADIAFGVEPFTLPEYIDWVVQNAAKFEEVELKLTGQTEEEKAAALVAEMIRTGLTRKMWQKPRPRLARTRTDLNLRARCASNS